MPKRYKGKTFNKTRTVIYDEIRHITEERWNELNDKYSFMIGAKKNGKMTEWRKG